MTAQNIDQNTIDSQIIRLVDEGVPVGALARAYGRRAEDLWPVIRLGVASGFLAALPAADWPPGTTRTDRRPVPVPAKRLTFDDLLIPLQRIYRLTPAEARFLALLVVQTEASSESLHDAATGADSQTDQKIVNVYAFKVRSKIGRHDLGLYNVWGSGYRITPRDRQTILQAIENYAQDLAVREARQAAIDQAFEDGI